MNVGSTVFLRYARIFIRKDGSTIGIPAGILNAVREEKIKYSVGTVKGFIVPRWTLEYCLAMSCLREKFHSVIKRDIIGKVIKIALFFLGMNNGTSHFLPIPQCFRRAVFLY